VVFVITRLFAALEHFLFRLELRDSDGGFSIVGFELQSRNPCVLGGFDVDWGDGFVVSRHGLDLLLMIDCCVVP